MKFNFKTQQYQTDAVNAVVSVFEGQQKRDGYTYAVDKGNSQLEFDNLYDLDLSVGYRNNPIGLTDDELLSNIKGIQKEWQIDRSTSLFKGMGKCSLDVEMETGTGKTYVYIKTMFELYEKYGWSKFIVVVPSIAIREGVKKSFEMTSDHFMSLYQKKARYFVYSSSNLNQLELFSSSPDINVMIINTQAFAASLKEGGNSKESRIIYSKRDNFGSRRPIDVIAANNPIIIMDEPQKMGGEVTKSALKSFNPLFTLNYSATHKEHHNLVYALDAKDAYQKNLVKKIEVKGLEVNNLSGVSGYLFLDRIIISQDEPKVKMEIEVKQNSGIKRKTIIMGKGDDLYYLSKELGEYKNDYIISDISALDNSVTFLNGMVIHTGEVFGDKTESDLRRIQIRETIESHIEKEQENFERGIKTLSLFFIDEVAKYKQYDEDGNVVEGEYWKMFEEEYNNVINEEIGLFDSDEYREYIKSIPVEKTHKGYFSIDKKGRDVDSALKRGSDISDDISAYDLILKDKERLLSFEEPTRFIFSHSALREGWDNPNIFQIGTLKKSDSSTQKRQEVGRGLRLCVDKDGNRKDKESLKSDFHKVNKLTIIASESYKEFAEKLQSEIDEASRFRPKAITKDLLTGLSVKADDGNEHVLTRVEASSIYRYLDRNDYLDPYDMITDKYKADADSDTLPPLDEIDESINNGVRLLIESFFNPKVKIENGHSTKIEKNNFTKKFKEAEFQEVWNQIKYKFSYSVSFDSEELIRQATNVIEKELNIPNDIEYVLTKGEQQEDSTSFGITATRSSSVERKSTASTVKYDLIGQISKATKLRRKTVAEILTRLPDPKFQMFSYNPEKFISEVTRIINQEKAGLVVENIHYTKTGEEYSDDIFLDEKHATLDKALKTKGKFIQEYIFTDGMSDESIERKFATDLEDAEEILAFAKLPKAYYYLPTPIGSYSPDWAIAYRDHNGNKQYSFVAETKGSKESKDLRGVEKIKTDCAKTLFNKDKVAGSVRYDIVTTYKDLKDVIKKDSD